MAAIFEIVVVVAFPDHTHSLCFQFGPGLCFYPVFRVPVWSSQKGQGHTLVQSLGSKYRERTWPITDGERNEPNPGSARFGGQRKTGPNQTESNPGSAFGEKNRPNPGSEKSRV